MTLGELLKGVSSETSIVVIDGGTTFNVQAGYFRNTVWSDMLEKKAFKDPDTGYYIIIRI